MVYFERIDGAFWIGMATLHGLHAVRLDCHMVNAAMGLHHDIERVAVSYRLGS
jgi:hypothetical protein